MLPCFLGNQSANRQISFKFFAKSNSSPVSVEWERTAIGKHQIIFDRKLQGKTDGRVYKISFGSLGLFLPIGLGFKSLMRPISPISMFQPGAGRAFADAAFLDEVLSQLADL